MVNYRCVRSKERTIIFAKDCDFESHVEINPKLISPEAFLALLRKNEVAPQHVQDIYDDLIFKKNMV